jgi:MinD superfamily P-loop ATPase
MQVQPPNPEHKRMKREKKTIGYMVDFYCNKHHITQEPCKECSEFKVYAFMRLDNCPFQDKKSTCGKCVIHCYRPDMKEKAKKIMRYSGPRMLLHHPSIAMHHAWDAHRKAPTLAKKTV